MVTALISQAAKLANLAVERFGVQIVRSHRHLLDPMALALNVGSGGYSIPGFIDLDVPSEHYDKHRSRYFRPYDMRADDLPFAAGTVDLIYCSHVIEHVESEHVGRFLAECARVLKVGGVLRISCPDAEFLWNVSSFENGYWSWLLETSNEEESRRFRSQMDCFDRQISTPVHRNRENLALPSDCSVSVDLESYCSQLCDANVFDSSTISDHISWWTYDRILDLAAGMFKHTIRSKYRGSVSAVMQSHYFDRTHPEMSLYVDLVR